MSHIKTIEAKIKITTTTYDELKAIIKELGFKIKDNLTVCSFYNKKNISEGFVVVVGEKQEIGVTNDGKQNLTFVLDSFGWDTKAKKVIEQIQSEYKKRIIVKALKQCGYQCKITESNSEIVIVGLGG